MNETFFSTQNAQIELPLALNGAFPKLSCVGQDAHACYFRTEEDTELYKIDFEGITIAPETMAVLGVLVSLHTISITDMNLLIAQYRQNVSGRRVASMDDFFRSTIIEDISRVMKENGGQGMFTHAGISVPALLNALSTPGKVDFALQQKFLSDFYSLYTLRDILIEKERKAYGMFLLSKEGENEIGVLARKLYAFALQLQEADIINGTTKHMHHENMMQKIKRGCLDDLLYESLAREGRSKRTPSSLRNVHFPLDVNERLARLKIDNRGFSRDAARSIILNALFS